MKKMGEEILSFFTRIKNWKVYLYAFTGSITGVALLTFFNYLILISIGVINVEETLLSIRTGTAVDLLGWNSIFLLVNGIGTGIGSLLSGKFADKSRRKTTSINYLIYIPLTILSVFPFFIFQEYLLALIFGIIGQILFGAIEGALGISNTTIRGDISKKEYPNLKATYFALLISCNNMGQSFGNLMGAWIMGFFVLIIPNFYTLYLILSIFCTITLIVSFFSFRLIDPKDYEFSHLFENVKEK